MLHGSYLDKYKITKLYNSKLGTLLGSVLLNDINRWCTDIVRAYPVKSQAVILTNSVIVSLGLIGLQMMALIPLAVLYSLTF
jgi:hypothetical protein